MPGEGYIHSRSYLHHTRAIGPGQRYGHWGTCGRGWCGRRWCGRRNVCVKLLVPVGGAAVAEGPDALPAFGDVEGASHTGVRHGDLPEAVLTAATLELLLVMTLWNQKKGNQHDIYQ